jgi:hypothetical protein
MGRMKWRVYLIVVTLSSLSITGNSQEMESEIVERYNSYNYNHSKEAAYLKTDKKIYFSGGIIGFNLVIFDQYMRPSRLSKIAYLELVHESNNMHEKYVIRLENGIQEGSIQIPPGVPTGNYQLIAYTQFMKNFDFEYLSQRLPIYIQNTSDTPKSVVSNIRYDSLSNLNVDEDSNNEYGIDLRVEQSKINIEVSSSERDSKDYYLVSEGFGSLQFIAKLKLKRKSSFLSFSNDQFKGSFQKLILLDEDKNVVALKYFYLEKSASVSKEVIFQNRLELGLKENLVSIIELNQDSFDLDTLDLFKRVYRLFYEIPLSKRINDLRYDELISTTYLSENSKYGLSRWSEILNDFDTNPAIKYYPEDNIQLTGQVKGDLESLSNSTLNIHFFKNNLDIGIPLSASGQFSEDLIIPVGKDAFYATIIDQNGKDISAKFKLEFNTFPNSQYVDLVDFHSTQLTNELIENQKNFNYILSTYNHSSTLKKFFWENSQFDRKIKIADYRDIDSFEEFLREVVTGVTIRKRDEIKSLRMINSDGGAFFDGSPLIILNNSVLKNCDFLFELPLESVESINLIFTEKSLNNFGEPFKNGVLAIAYDDSRIPIPKSSLNESYFEFVGYQERISYNEVMKGFSSSKMMNIISADYFEKSLEHNKESGVYKLTLQGISQDGTFYKSSKEVLIEKD